MTKVATSGERVEAISSIQKLSSFEVMTNSIGVSIHFKIAKVI